MWTRKVFPWASCVALAVVGVRWDRDGRTREELGPEGSTDLGLWY